MTNVSRQVFVEIKPCGRGFRLACHVHSREDLPEVLRLIRRLRLQIKLLLVTDDDTGFEKLIESTLMKMDEISANKPQEKRARYADGRLLKLIEVKPSRTADRRTSG